MNNYQYIATMHKLGNFRGKMISLFLQISLQP